MAFGSTMTMNPLQMLYAAKMYQSMSPWIKPTQDRLTEFSSSPISAYQPMADWNKFISQKYTQPLQYTLSQRLANIQNSPERFSFGRQYREAQAMNAMNQGVGQGTMADLLSERQLQMGSQTNALARQLQSLGIEGQTMMAPLQIKAVENTARPMTLFESIFRGMS